MEDPSPNSVILEIEGFSLECDRFDLIRHSDYFKAMLEGNFIESGKKTILLKGIELEAMKTILKLLWDHEYIIEEENVYPVLQAACMLQFLQVRDICVERLDQFLSINNCLKIWQYTDRLDLTNICGRAKLLALLEFMSVRETRYFLELGLDEVVEYLGSVYLRTPDEFKVFESVMSWYRGSEQKPSVILKLLHCMDWTMVTPDEISRIMSEPILARNDEVCDILKCVVAIKNGADVENASARSLLTSKSRNPDGKPCILVENVDRDATNYGFLCYDRFKRKRQCIMLVNKPTNTVACYDVGTPVFRKLFQIDTKKWEILDGFQISSYKNLVFLYGGEFSLGKGDWNWEFIIYNVTKDSWRKQRMPFPRRHFATCVCGKYLYIIGGTGSYRVIQENMFWYDIEAEKWSKELKLPCSAKQILCCNFKDQLFVINISNKCGYLYKPEDKNWTSVPIRDTDRRLTFYSENIVVFYYKDALYIKGGDQLFQLELENEQLFVVKHRVLPKKFSDVNRVESVLCNNVLYSLNKYSSDETEEQAVSLELLNIDTCEVTYQELSPTLDIDGETYKFGSAPHLFKVFHPKLVKRKDLVNCIN